MVKVIQKYKLVDDTYLFELEVERKACLAVAKVDKDGNIVRITTFGDNAPKARYNKLNR